MLHPRSGDRATEAHNRLAPAFSVAELAVRYRVCRIGQVSVQIYVVRPFVEATGEVGCVVMRGAANGAEFGVQGFVVLRGVALSTISRRSEHLIGEAIYFLPVLRKVGYIGPGATRPS